MYCYSEFEKNKNKSSFVHQYHCKKCEIRWWGTSSKNRCAQCNETVEKLSLKQMIGVGWFECSCGRRYPGFSRGDDTLNCHGCQKPNSPSFIVPGELSSTHDNQHRVLNHYCGIFHYCKSSHCPVFSQAQNSKHARRF